METELTLGQFCSRVGIPSRAARYVLERGFVPAGVPAAPATGNHRRFDARQAIWLALVVFLRQNGVRTPLAARIADAAQRQIGYIAQRFGWDFRFFPQRGELTTDRVWLVDVAEEKYLRVVTKTPEGTIEELPWNPITDKRPPRDYKPVVALRIDVGAIARRLARD